MKVLKICSIIVFSCLFWGLQLEHLQAQEIIFDRGVRAGQLNCFPLVSDPNTYKYLPDKIQVAEHPNGDPMFSFTRYVRNTGPTGTSSGISESNEAGGIVHVVVSLAVPDEMVDEARRELRRVNSNAKLEGPIIYQSGKIALISSVAGDDGELTRRVVGLGSAPILEGQKAAISVLLTKQGSDILWATFQSPTPDLSFQFEMDAKGYQSPKSVRIEADFEQIYSHKSIEAAAVTPTFAAEIKAAFDDLSNSGAIKVTQIGEDADLQKMQETAYNQLVNLIFDKVGGEGIANFNELLPNNEKSMLDRATEMLDKARKEARDENERLAREARSQAEFERRVRAAARARIDSVLEARGIDAPESPDADEYEAPEVERVPVPSFAIAASFVLKKTRRSGKYFVDLNKYTEDLRSFPFSENVGDILSRCKKCFVSVNLDDDLYKQREISVRVQGINNQDFGNYVSSIEVIVKKTHENGAITYQNVIVDKKTFNEEAGIFRMMYGWKDDYNRENWFDYEYKTKWVFAGGFSVESGWKTQDYSSIDLVPPLVKKDVYVELDPDLVDKKKVRAAEVKIYFENDGRQDLRVVNLKAGDNILSKSVQLILPKDSDDYEYEVTWFLKGKPPVRVPKTSYNYGSIYLDTI